jgi:hypothetical protein
VKSDVFGAENAGVAAAASAVGASPRAPIAANMVPAPPLRPTARRNPRRDHEAETFESDM